MWWIAPLWPSQVTVGDTGGVVHMGRGSKAYGLGRNRCEDQKNTFDCGRPTDVSKICWMVFLWKNRLPFFTLMYYSQCFIIVDSDLIIMLLFPVRIW